MATENLLTLIVGQMQVNCYILFQAGQREAIVIDPGGDVDDIVSACEGHGIVPEYVLLTHAHCDHIGGVEALLKRFPSAKLAAHRDEIPLLKQPTLNLSWFLNTSIKLEAPDIVLEHDMVIRCGAISVRTITIPGHSPGGCAFYLAPRDDAKGILIPGDILFAGSIGRTDFPGGCLTSLLNGIKKHLLVLPPDTRVLPGHGPETSIGDEILNNPFLKSDAKFMR